MKPNIKFIVYSDIHHHEYTNGLTGDDVSAIEDQFYSALVEHKPDFWMFLGDRFMSRNPLDVSRRRADFALKRNASLGIQGIMLPGNHDQYTKSAYSNHSLWTSDIFTNDLKNIFVFNKADTFKFKIGETTIAVHGIPAGMAIPDFDTDSNDFNILVFHGTVKHSLFTNGTTAQHGIDSKLIDKSKYDLVLGGDNHHYQELKLHNTTGYYVGAPMQHNWGDAEDTRGFLFCEFDGKPRVSRIHTKYPTFNKVDAQISLYEDIFKLFDNNAECWKDSIIDLSISSSNKILDMIQPHDLADKLNQEYKLRAIDVHLMYSNEELKQPVSAIILSDNDEWADYVAKHSVNTSLDVNKIIELGNKYIEESK